LDVGACAKLSVTHRRLGRYTDVGERLKKVRTKTSSPDLAGVAHGLLDFLGVEWDDAVLAHTDHARQRGA